MVFFDTGLDGWRYATHGGTAFVVNFQGRPYVFTCRHVLQDFEWRQIVITDRKFGHLVPGLESVSYPSRPHGDAMEAEVLDVAAIKFSEDITPAFFGDTAYLLDRGTVETSATGDRLRVAGALKVESEIDATVIAPLYCLLKFTDAGNSPNDPTLRCAVAKFADPEFASLTGLSGAHVFNETGNALCGMVVRATTKIADGRCVMHYVDLFDMMQLLKAVQQGREDTHYRKSMLVRQA